MCSGYVHRGGDCALHRNGTSSKRPAANSSESFALVAGRAFAFIVAQRNRSFSVTAYFRAIPSDESNGIELARFYAATIAPQAAALARATQESGTVLAAFDESMF